MRPMTALWLHRELCDIFDEYAWMTFEAPTIRINDNHIQVHRKWTVGNLEHISGRLDQL
ncbi:hypothetical protein LCGC14_3056800 [marine sediment metagenome]|uniref:Uncharacterized protein n=1 Tax=marine sediment metagenome TaxID=412755 RepID=A0A0F8YSW0_9ZZZZ